MLRVAIRHGAILDEVEVDEGATLTVLHAAIQLQVILRRVVGERAAVLVRGIRYPIIIERFRGSAT